MKKQLLLIGIFTGIGLSSLAQEQKWFLYFNTASDQLTETEKGRLDSFIKGRTSEWKILSVTGHCDTVGSFEYNLDLSRRRVKTVIGYLKQKGLATDSIATRGYGYDHPIQPNGTEEGRSFNRRVEIDYLPASKQSAPPHHDPPVLVKVGLRPDTLETKREVEIDNETFFEKNEKDMTLRLRNMNFHGGVDIFLSEAYPPLQYLLEVMLQYPNLKIRIEGHICCSTSETGFEMDLSIRRAQRVYDFLVAGGIDPGRLSYKGFGGTRHLVVENTERDRSTNRRVEIRLLNETEGKVKGKSLNYAYLSKINSNAINSDSSFSVPLFYNSVYPLFRETSQPSLETLFHWLQQNPGKGLSMKLDMGYEADEINMTRIQTLLPFYYLISKGIDPRRLRYEGYYSSISEEEMRLRLKRYRTLPDAKLECRVFKVKN